MAKRSSFRDRVIGDAKRSSTKYGYLRLPQGVQMFKEEAGIFLLDIIPYEVADKNHPDRDDDKETALPKTLWYKRPFKTHGNVGPNNETVVCPTSINKSCPICEYRQTQTKAGVEWEKLRDLNPSRRNLYLVIPRDAKKYKEEIHIWNISAHCFQDFLRDELKVNEENGIFPDLDEGKTLRVRFNEASIGKNKYAKASRIDFEDRKPLKESILDDAPNLDDCLTVLSNEQIHAKFFEMEDEKVEEAEEVVAEQEIEEVRPRRAKDEEVERRTRRPDNDDKPKRGKEEDEERPRRSRREEVEPEPERETRSSRGNGKDKEPDEERPRRGSKKEEDDNPCPAGYRFGLDNDKYPECSDCKVWEKCIDEKQALQKASARR